MVLGDIFGLVSQLQGFNMDSAGALLFDGFGLLDVFGR
jgi:hypothetical protein